MVKSRSGAAANLKPHTVDKEDTLTYDVGNLCAYDHEELDHDDYHQRRAAYLLELGRDNAQLLFNRIFDCPTETADLGRLATLPRPTTSVPREKPLPKPKEDTKWEAFAKAKGIQNKKRDRMVFDEHKQDWAPRYGYKRANDQSEQWLIEDKAGMSTSEDPFTALKKQKKERAALNKKQQERNLQAAAGERVPGTIDLSSATHLGNKKGGEGKRKNHVDVALALTQHSTASMGKFDKMRYSEAPIREKKEKVKNRSAASEKSKSLAILSSLGGGVADDFNVGKATNSFKQQKEKKAAKAKK